MGGRNKRGGAATTWLMQLEYEFFGLDPRSTVHLPGAPQRALGGPPGPALYNRDHADIDSPRPPNVALGRELACAGIEQREKVRKPSRYCAPATVPGRARWHPRCVHQALEP